MRWQRVALGIVIALAILTRFLGIAHKNDTDENKFVNPAATLRVRNVQRPLFPGGARYPHFGYYAQAGIFWVVGHTLQTDAWDRTLVARITGATVGVLTVALAVWVGRQLGGWPLGLLGGLFLAVSPLAVKYAHYAHVDTPAAFFMLAAVAVALLLWERGTLRWYAATGALVGLAFGVQYYGITIGAALVLAHAGWALRQPTRWRSLVRPAFFAGLLMIPLTFALTNPWKIVAWREAIESYRSLALRAEGGDLGYTSPHILWPLTTRSPDWGLPFTVSGLAWETPLTLFLLALLGIVAAVRRRDARVAVLVGGLLVILYVAIAGYVRMHAVKRFLPLTPLLSLAAAYGVLHAPALLPRARRALRLGMVALSLGGIGAALWNVGAFDFAYAREATLPSAVAWAEANLPEKSLVLQHGPVRFLLPDKSRHRVVTLHEEYANIGGRHDRRIADHRARPLAEFLAEGVDYIVIDSRMADRYYEPTAVAMYPEMTDSYREFYDTVRTRGTRVYEIRPVPWQRAGPRIEIYDVRDLDSS